MFTLKSPSLILMSLIASCSLILSTTSSCAMSFSLSASPSLPGEEHLFFPTINLLFQYREGNQSQNSIIMHRKILYRYRTR